MNLRTPIEQVLRTTKDYIAALHAINVRTVQDLLLLLPKGHEDLSSMHTIESAPIGEKVTIRGTVEHIKLVMTRSRKQFVTADFTDDQGETIEAIWFNQGHIKRMLSDGDEVVFTGKLTQKGRKIQFQSPIFESGSKQNLTHSGRIVPVYIQHDILNSRWLREKIEVIRGCIALLPETIPEDILLQEGLLPRSEAIEQLHFPTDGVLLKQARERIAFEEMYHLQTHVLLQKKDWQGVEQQRLELPIDVELIRAFFSSLHFTPTDGQRIAIYEILKDMNQPRPMSRLLEGDVGSGKTMVATAVMANVMRHGGQCALMVPTEVLARQHVSSIGKTLINFYTYLEAEHSAGRGDHLPRMRHPNIAILTGSMAKGEADEVRQKIASGTVDLVIGTHSLIQDSVRFNNLSLVIVDEQHRFGVNQRDRLKEKGNPHFLAMTATPIPRTLALTAHGQHDLSVLIEKPGNRKEIDTKVVAPSDRDTVEHFIEHQIQAGRQVFVVCPLIKESENEDFAEIKSVEFETARLKTAFPKRNIRSLHGKMTAAEKQTTMEEFKAKQFNILVSTSVIEVGIDVPNATIIIIEGAERFGLSQLHQFRGRVGRGEHKSYCFLCTTNQQQAYSKRLKAIEQHTSGFKLAEIDLQLRGPGDMLGTRQSGLPEVSAATLLNPDLVVRARRAAEKVLFGKESTPM